MSVLQHWSFDRSLPVFMHGIFLFTVFKKKDRLPNSYLYSNTLLNVFFTSMVFGNVVSSVILKFFPVFFSFCSGFSSRMPSKVEIRFSMLHCHRKSKANPDFTLKILMQKHQARSVGNCPIRRSFGITHLKSWSCPSLEMLLTCPRSCNNCNYSQLKSSSKDDVNV